MTDTVDTAAENGPRHRVVVNSEEQYSVWLARRELPAGWHAEGTEGSRDACLARIGELWTDLRPRSVRAGGAPL